MVYVTYNTKDNYIHTISPSKIVGVSGDLVIAEVDIIPNYDISSQRLKATNIRTRIESYTEQVEKIDDEGNVVIDENGEVITETITKIREYTTCDFIVEQDPKKTYLSELQTLQSWFEVIYDNQVKQYQRCERLGIPYDNKYGTIETLDNLAHENALRIAELKNLIGG